MTAMVVMAGCAVDPTIDDGSDGDSIDQASSSAGSASGSTDPNQTFKTQIKPITDPKCLPCHNGSTSSPQTQLNLTSFATLDVKYRTKPGASSPLVTKGLHEGPTFTAAEATKIVNWINGLPDPTDPSSTYDAYVKPIFTQLCTQCHNANLPPNFTSYATLAPRYKAKPGASSPLVNKGIHEGPSLTAAQATTVINWINSQP